MREAVSLKCRNSAKTNSKEQRSLSSPIEVLWGVNENSKHFSSSERLYICLELEPLTVSKPSLPLSAVLWFLRDGEIKFFIESTKRGCFEITVRSLGCKLDVRLLLVSTDSE